MLLNWRKSMPTTRMPVPDAMLRYRYEQAAREYCERLPMEHFMESTAQSTQKHITMDSMGLVKKVRPDVHVFSELLVQYPKRGALGGIGRVCPDTMVVVYDGPIEADGSFDTPDQPAGPF